MEVVGEVDTAPSGASQTLVVIGTSTGGPRALKQIFTALPVLDGGTCCIVQHMPVGFTANFAKRLDASSAWCIREGRHGDQLENGTAYLAPGGMQMRVAGKEDSLHLNIAKEESSDYGHQPSVDVLFKSAARLCPRMDVVGVLLTGMGRDGVAGLADIHNRGGYTIAEAEESAVIYGMPKAAAERGAASTIVPLWEIPKLLKKRLGD